LSNRSPDKPNSALVATLPSQFGLLTQLKCLDISHNGLSVIPAACFTGLVNLEKLWLGGNALTALGVDIGAMSSLQELDLSNNRLTALPPEMASLKQLKDLNVENNLLAELPAHLSTIPFLNKLQVGPQNGCMRYACLLRAALHFLTYTAVLTSHRRGAMTL
jgi:Leucine-rich repeat (LRR) protein